MSLSLGTMLPCSRPSHARPSGWIVGSNEQFTKMQSKNCGRSLSRIILHFWNVHLWKLTSPPGLNVKVSFSNCRSKEVDDMGLAYCKLSRSRHPAGLFLPRRRQSAPTNTTPSPLARLQHRRRSHLICRSPSATPISSPALPTASADSGQCRAATRAGFFWHPPVRRQALCFGGDCRNWVRTWISTDSNEPRYIRKPLNLLDDCRKRDSEPRPCR